MEDELATDYSHNSQPKAHPIVDIAITLQILPLQHESNTTLICECCCHYI